MAFLPPHVVRALASPVGRRTPRRARRPAALLYSDISGFTALTERLHAHGRRGAEEIGAIISAAFQPAIRAIGALGGSIQSFGGDALFAIFEGRGPVGRAVAAAREIHSIFARGQRRATGIGSFALQIAQVVHFGVIEESYLGTRARSLHVVAGPAVQALARLQGRGKGRPVFVSPPARRAMSGEGFSRRLPVQRPPGPAGAWLKPFFPPGLLPLLGRFEGEYRKATILFLETKGRALRAMQSFFLHVEAALDTYDGVLLKTDLSADGLKWLCAFGIPAAHEEDLERAARAALRIREGVPHGMHLRGGLHAGTIVNLEIGTRSRRSFDVMGDVVNTAARALAEGAWGQLVVTRAVRDALAGIQTDCLGSRMVKGKAEPLELHALRDLPHAAIPVRARAPLVGRDEELRLLRDAIDAARQGQGGTVAIQGEAGMGKSRLKWETSTIARASGFEILEGRAISFGGATYWAIGEAIRQSLGLGESADPAEILCRVEEDCGALDLSATDRHHLADVLGARWLDSPLRHLDAKAIRLNNMIAIRNYALARSRRRPLLLVLEDMQWADELSREAVEYLAREAPSAPVLLLLLSRPGYVPPASIREIALYEISSEAVAQMIRALLGDVPERVTTLVRERAGGNPFYVEELARHLNEREPGSEDLPETIERLISARLDRLAKDARRVAQVASVVGRSFLFELLAHIEEVGRVARPAIEELLVREIVFEWQRDPHLEYIFKHALIRDVAYETILVAARRKLHRAVAEAMEELLHEERDAYLAMLGHHWERAGAPDKARACYLAAARRSAAAYASEEAERLYRGYRALVGGPTAESVEARCEIADVLVLRGSVEEALLEQRRALEEARCLGDGALQARALREVGLLLHHKGQTGEATRLYKEALAMAQRSGDRRGEGSALGSLAALLSEQGSLDEARRLLRRALGIFGEIGDRRRQGIALMDLSGDERREGRMAEAQSLEEQALACFRDVGDRRREGHVLGNIANRHLLLGQWHEAGIFLDRALAILREVGDRTALGVFLGNQAYLRHQQGRTEEAVALYDETLAILRDTLRLRSEGPTLANAAALYLEEGRIEEARTASERALEIARQVQDRQCEALALGNLARIQRLVEGSLDEAERLAALADSLASDVDVDVLAQTLCEHGHVAMAAGRTGRPYLERVTWLAGAIGVGEQSELARLLEKLRRAVEAFERGEPLFRGELESDIPPKLMQALRTPTSGPS